MMLGDPYTAAAMVALQTVQKLTNAGVNQALQTSGAAASGNEDQLIRGSMKLASEFSILGQVADSLVNKVMDLSDAIEGQAKRLAVYDPGLANFYAMDGVRREMRDMQRAKEFGQEYLQAAQARQALDNSLGKLADKLLTDVLAVATDLIDIIRTHVDTVTMLVQIFKDLPGPVKAMVESVIGGPLLALVRVLGMIARNTRPAEGDHNRDVFMTQFKNARNDVFSGPTAGSSTVPGFGP
jgi:hypothetical protein